MIKVKFTKAERKLVGEYAKMHTESIRKIRESLKTKTDKELDEIIDAFEKLEKLSGYPLEAYQVSNEVVIGAILEQQSRKGE